MYKYIFLLVFIASAAQAKSIVDCKDEEGRDARLACVDAIFDERRAERAEEQDEEEAWPPSPWLKSVSTSPLDDSKTVVLSNTSTNQFANPYGQRGRGNLIVRCKENTTTAYLTFNDNFMADIQGRGRVDYRVDQQPARHRNMNVSTDNMALGLWSGGRSIPWIKEMFGGEELFIRATPFSESPLDMTFDISGLEEQITELREACHW